jgi:nitrogen fixation protein FixH
MTPFPTLFGGALLIVALYYLLRAFGVGNYWRGIIGGLVPLLGYLGLSALHGQGGDVIAMHLAVYLATATILTMIGWRGPQTDRHLHWGPKVIIAFFLVLFVVDGAFLLISGLGVPSAVAGWLLPPAKKTQHAAHTAFSGVVPHGEEAAKAVNQYLASSDKQNRLGWEISMSGLEHPTQDRPATVTVTAHAADRQPLSGAAVALALLRPGLAQAEAVVELAEADAGVYRGRLNVALPGLWVAAVRLERGGERYELQQHIEVGAAP